MLAPGLVVLLAVAAGGPAFGGGGAVMLQTSDVSCWNDSADFYVACGNGTVTDNRTGLVWLANANCFGQLTWADAMAIVAGLGDLSEEACAGMTAAECDCGLSDSSSPGEWRLPSIAEWKSMITGGWDGDSCAPAIANDVGNGCWDELCAELDACSFHDVEAAGYWSASPFIPQPANAWCGDLVNGGPDILDRTGTAFVWPVRGGQ